MFPELYNEKFNGPTTLPYTKDSLSDTMVHSISLTNASHYDFDDISHTCATWIEEFEGITNNWYLVFPNVCINGSKGMVIKLFDGCTVNWDASLLRHASSKVNYNFSKLKERKEKYDKTEILKLKALTYNFLLFHNEHERF